ncbi:hypothetical protein B0H17DRAFT_1083040 [Mycena rosella]|uniref:Uncharacterized protein n=1 Tax=Mycena rosella TaxID=1033263 RepID=A0AAD7D1B0_MYCRO|nr:hypothetical protein B0H17DRAFT_1083040 [Mycena rosella]
MSEPSDHERLNRVPPTDYYCALCAEGDEDDESMRMQKCSVCKNAFYCVLFDASARRVAV